MMSTIELLNLDTQENQVYYDSGYSDAPSPGSSSTSSRMMGSPMSQTSDGSRNNMFNLYQFDEPIRQIGFQRNTTFFTPQMTTGEAPKLVILEEPVDKFRFRYKSEMHGTHGSLMGSNNGKSRKTFPTVELRGYEGRAVIRCSLYQTSETLEPSPHSHKLVVRHNDIDVSDPHDLRVSKEEGYKAVFQGMGIIHTAKKHIFEELVSKKIREKQFQLGRQLTTLEESNVKVKAEKEAKAMNLNQVRLAFTAYAINPDESWTYLCGPVFSRSINNMKSALTGELKISRLSAAVSSAAGGDDLILLVEKVGKKNIKVKFYEVDEDNEVVWFDWGIFSEADVHHQYAIALRTPPYKDKDIDKHVEVYIQLFRPTDGDVSEPVPFRYKPRDFTTSRKRARTNSSGLSSLNIPETVMDEVPLIKDSPQNSYSGLEMLNKSDVIEEFLRSAPLKEFDQRVMADSNELMKYFNNSYLEDIDKLETDGATPMNSNKKTLSKINKFAKYNSSEIEPQMSTIPTRKFDPSIRVEPQMMDPIALPKNYNSFGVIPEGRMDSLYLSYFSQICSAVRRCGNGNSDSGKARADILDIFQVAKSQHNCNLLHDVIREGNNNVMVKLLRLIDRLEINEVLQHQNENRQSCLHIACVFDRSEYIRPLINLGTNPNIQDHSGNTALHVAVEEGMLMCTSKIIDKANYTKKSQPLQIDLANDDGLTPLHVAVKKRDLALVKKLLEVGEASTKISISKNGNNVLHLAVEQNNKSIVKYLLENTNVNINEPNTSGFTALGLAYSMGTEAKAVVQLLLEHGATSGPSSSGSNASQETPMDTDVTPKRSNTDESSEEDEYEDKPLQIDEFSMEDNDKSESLLDDECIKQLKVIFDKDNKWQKLAKVLKLDTFLNIWKMGEESASLAMFHYINVSNIKTQQLVSAMELLDEQEAVNRIGEMLNRKKT